jgi:hypothetical protein
MTALNRLCKTLDEIGAPYELTDDSAESGPDEDVRTVVLLRDPNRPTSRAVFAFRRDGSFKEFMLF